MIICYTLFVPPRPLLSPSTWTDAVTPPPISVHPKNIQALIRRLRTPFQVQDWLHTLKYNPAETMHTLPVVVRRGRAHCLEAALSAAAILEYHGYPPLIIDLQSTDYLDHTLFLFRHYGRYGTIGVSHDIGLAGRRPVYSNILSLVKSYAAPYIDAEACIKGYGVLDLRTLSKGHWRTSPKSVWYAEKAFDKNHHRRFHLSPRYIQYWRQRYIDFHRQYPNQQPLFYPNQKNWL